jgi:hypothetical protein
VKRKFSARLGFGSGMEIGLVVTKYGILSSYIRASLKLEQLSSGEGEEKEGYVQQVIY